MRSLQDVSVTMVPCFAVTFTSKQWTTKGTASRHDQSFMFRPLSSLPRFLFSAASVKTLSATVQLIVDEIK